LDALAKAASLMFPQDMDPRERLQVSSERKDKGDVVRARTELIEALSAMAREAYERLTQQVNDPGIQTEVERAVALRTLDDLWIGHLMNMDYMRHGVCLQGYGQRDPLVEYKRESYRLFHEVLSNLNQRVANTIFKVQISRQAPDVAQQQVQPPAQEVVLSGPEKEEAAPMVERSLESQAVSDVGRNDPCPCGSGKKYKKCHGQDA